MPCSARFCGCSQMLWLLPALCLRVTQHCSPADSPSGNSSLVHTEVSLHHCSFFSPSVLLCLKQVLRKMDIFCRRNSLPTKPKRMLNWCLKRSQVGSSVRSLGIIAKKAIRPCPRSNCSGFAVVGWISPQF